MDSDTETSARRHPKRTTFVSEQTWTKFGQFKASIIGRRGENAVGQSLSGLGLPALHDVLLADELSVTQVDHLVRAAAVIFVIETKTYGGHITGSLGSAEWVQHLAGGDTRHAFQNPVRQNHRHCRAVQVALTGLAVPVAGLVVSAGAATFCDELQGLVVPLASLPEVLHSETRGHHNPKDIEVAWQRLVAARAAGESRREEHRDTVQRRRCGHHRSG